MSSRLKVAFTKELLRELHQLIDLDSMKKDKTDYQRCFMAESFLSGFRNVTTLDNFHSASSQTGINPYDASVGPASGLTDETSESPAAHSSGDIGPRTIREGLHNVKRGEQLGRDS
jgi:hypothetical protein